MEKEPKFISQEFIREYELEFSPEKILSMKPKELMDWFAELDEKGELELFLDKAKENESLMAMFSYWEKWLSKDQRVLVDEAVAKKREIYGEKSESLPLELEKKFSDDELKLIFSNTQGIQLTFGCSKACPFCALDAVPGVREHISYSQLANLFQKYGTLLHRSSPMLYHASEPSDYASKEGLEDKTYEDVHQLAEQYAGYSPGVSSREIKNKEWLNFLGIKEKNARVSLFSIDSEKIKDVKEITKNKIDIVGEGDYHTKGIGVSSLETQQCYGEGGVGCYNGMLITPRGLYNILQIPISEKFPQGQIVMPFNNFSDKQIKNGDELKDLLQGNIVGHEEKSISVFSGRYKKLHLLCKDGVYFVETDKNGVVIDNEKIFDLEKLEEYENLHTKVSDLIINKEKVIIEIEDWIEDYLPSEKIDREYLENEIIKEVIQSSQSNFSPKINFSFLDGKELILDWKVENVNLGGYVDVIKKMETRVKSCDISLRYDINQEKLDVKLKKGIVEW